MWYLWYNVSPPSSFIITYQPSNGNSLSADKSKIAANILFPGIQNTVDCCIDGLYPPWLSFIGLVAHLLPTIWWTHHHLPKNPPSSLHHTISRYSGPICNILSSIVVSTPLLIHQVQGVMLGWVHSIIICRLMPRRRCTSNDGWCKNTHFAHQSWELIISRQCLLHTTTSHPHDGLWPIWWTGTSLHWVWWAWRPPSPPPSTCIILLWHKLKNQAFYVASAYPPSHAYNKYIRLGDVRQGGWVIYPAIWCHGMGWLIAAAAISGRRE